MPAAPGDAAAGQRDRDARPPSPVPRPPAAAGSVFPAPVAATTIAVRSGRDGRVQQRPVHRDRRGDEMDPLRRTGRRRRDAAGCRDAGRRVTPASRPTRPSEPPFGLANVSSADACILTHVVRRLDRPGEADDDARATHRRRGGDADRVAQVRRAVEAGLVRRPHRPGHDDRLRAVEDEVPAERSSPRSCRCPGRRPRRRSIGSASASRRTAAMSSSVGNVKWLAGVRPRSMATTSAIASSPGVRARIAGPSSTGHVAAGDRIEGRADRPAGEDDAPRAPSDAGSVGSRSGRGDRDRRLGRVARRVRPGRRRSGGSARRLVGRRRADAIGSVRRVRIGRRSRLGRRGAAPASATETTPMTDDRDRPARR